MHPDLVSSEGYRSKIGWYVIYKDGTTVSSDEQTSDKIDRKNISKFILVSKSDGRAIVTQRLEKGQKLIYRSRTAMRSQGVLDRIHILGWSIDSESLPSPIRHVAFVFESDGSVEMGDFIDKDSEHINESPWLYPIELEDYDHVVVE